jgi:O-antigen ligase
VAGQFETRNEHKFFWPTLTAIAAIVAARKLSRGGKAYFPTNILCLIVCVAFAGMTVLWAFSPSLSFIRFSQQAMVVTSIILPAMLTGGSVDLTRGIFLCFAFSVTFNILFVTAGYQSIADGVATGYSGYFTGKNYLGQCGAIALLLAFHELLHRGLRRAVGIVVSIASIVIIFFANSKTSLGLAFLIPTLAGLMLIAKRTMRISPAVFVWLMVLGYFVFSGVTGFSMARLSYMIYGDSTFTGRQIIWDFVNLEIAQKPLLGWGYQSFWLVGPTGPSVVDAPGWVKAMPNGHSGYYDTILELGYVGFALLLAFITATLHRIGQVVDQDLRRGWILLSLALFVMIYNGLESTWMRGFEFMWVVFLIVAAETARYRQPARVAGRPAQVRRSPARSQVRRAGAKGNRLAASAGE